MKSGGAEIIDPVEIPPDGKIGEPEMEVLLYEFKAGLNAYLKSRGRTETLASTDRVQRKEPRARTDHFGQELF